PTHQYGSATGALDGGEVQDRDLAVDGAVPQPQLGAPGFAGRAEPDGRPRAGVEVVDPRLEDIHPVLLWCPLRHPTRLSFIWCKIASPCPGSSSRYCGWPIGSRVTSCAQYAGSQAG